MNESNLNMNSGEGFSGKPISAAAVELQGLTKLFGARKAVDCIDLTVHAGEIFALLGPNGAGKSTLIRILCSLTRPSQGSAKIFGADVDLRSIETRKMISVCPQETAIAPHLNCRENLLLMAGLYGIPVKRARVRSDSLIGEFGLSCRAQDQARRLSGGMQRKLSIAMSLVCEPRVLFLDEPTLGLDPQSRTDLWERIAALKTRTTVIFSTHYLEEADAIADRIAIIDNGRIIRQGKPEELKKTLFPLQTFVIKMPHLEKDNLERLNARFFSVLETEKGIEVSGENLDFDLIAGFMKSLDVRVEGIGKKEASLEDVFLYLTKKESNR